MLCKHPVDSEIAHLNGASVAFLVLLLYAGTMKGGLHLGC